MSRWFRFYDDTINKAKVLKLSDRTFRIWVGMLCLASKNEGVLPSFEDMVILLRIKADKLQPEIETLIAAELLDHTDAGIIPHNWNKRQYKSDVSTERVKRFRNAERNVSETPPENRVQTTEQITEKKDSRTVAKATRPKTSEAFEDFWKAYPRRLGANPKAPAFKKFSAAVGQGADPAVIIEGARRCAVEDHDKIGTPYIPQAVKWLGDQRWADYAAAPPGASGLSDDERKAMFEKLRKPNEQRAGTDLRGAGSSPCEVKGIGGKEPTSHADNQTRNTGMASLGAILREPSGVRAGGDEACPIGDEPGVHRPG